MQEVLGGWWRAGRREAEPVSERDGIVTVACRSAVWAQELDLMTGELPRPPQRGPRLTRRDPCGVSRSAVVDVLSGIRSGHVPKKCLFAGFL